jgi:hypothetical protein
MRKSFIWILALSSVLVFSLSFTSLKSQEQLDFGKILGDWSVNVDADGEYYYLSLHLEKDESGLKGTISESMASFTDSPLSNIEYDGQSLSFEFTAPTPPDGFERVVKVEFEVGEEEMEGYVVLEDLGFSAPASASREKDQFLT